MPPIPEMDIGRPPHTGNESPANGSVFLKKKALRWTAFFLLLCPIAAAGWLALYAWHSAPQQKTEYTIVTIPPGSGIRQIRKILAEAKLVDDDIRFLLLAKVLGLSRKLPAGEFRLSLGKKPGEVLRQLAMAKPVQYAVTIPEGLRLEEVAEIFAAGSWCDRDRFLALAHDPDFIHSLGLPSVPSLEGYLYPDTYHLTHDLRDTKELIAMQVARFFQIWSALPNNAGQQMSRHEVVTLASVVEKETGDSAERPIIAGVFLNRLKTGMRLQSDPTVVYGLEDFSGNLTRTDLKTEHPYNTYVVPALPAGPICNPGQKAMEAVLRPAPTDFFYFVSKNNGTHQFSKDLSEHNQAVQEYQHRKKSSKQ